MIRWTSQLAGAAALCCVALSGAALAQDETPAPGEAVRRVYRYRGPLLPAPSLATTDREALGAQFRDLQSLLNALGKKLEDLPPGVRDSFIGLYEWVKAGQDGPPLVIEPNTPAQAVAMVLETWRLWRLDNPVPEGQPLPHPPADFVEELSAALMSGHIPGALATRRAALEQKALSQMLARGNIVAWREIPAAPPILESVSAEALAAALAEPLDSPVWEALPNFEQTYPLQDEGGRRGYVLLATNALDFKRIKPDLQHYIVDAARQVQTDRQTADRDRAVAEAASPRREAAKAILRLMRAELAKPEPSEDVLLACLEALEKLPPERRSRGGGR
jgi:hypothetical protein